MTVERPLTKTTKIMENGYDNPIPIAENTSNLRSEHVDAAGYCARSNDGNDVDVDVDVGVILHSNQPPPAPYTLPLGNVENTRMATTNAAGVQENEKSNVYVIPLDHDQTSKHTSKVCNVRNNERNKNLSAKNEKQQPNYRVINGSGINGNDGRRKVQNNLSEKAYIDYDPHQHIQQKNPTSYWDTMFHLLRASLGTGILAMPNAFQNAGYAVGLIGTLVIGFMCTYNIHMLVSSEYELCKRRKVPSMTYPETVQAAIEEGPVRLRKLAPFGRCITNLFLVCYQVGSSSIYAVFIASNLKDVYDSYYVVDSNVRIIMLYLLAPSVLICWVRNLKLLVPFSTIGNAATVVSFALIFWFVFQEVPSFADRQPVGTIKGIPLFFGTVLFAMEAIGVVMPLKNQMKQPKRFGSLCGVLNASMVPITILYTFMGFFGYLKYGSDTKGSITLNLPSDKPLAKMVKLLYSGAIFITYGLSNYVIYDIVWNTGVKSNVSFPSKFRRIFWEYVVRTSIVFVTFFLAGAVPNLEIFISFVGAFCLSAIGVAFPAIIQILTFWHHHDDTFQFSIMIFKNIIIIMIAILAFTIGVSTSVIKFINEQS